MRLERHSNQRNSATIKPLEQRLLDHGDAGFQVIVSSEIANDAHLENFVRQHQDVVPQHLVQSLIHLPYGIFDPYSLAEIRLHHLTDWRILVAFSTLS